MPKNRFSDLPKNINNEGWREETTKEKNPQELASSKIRCKRRRRTVCCVCVCVCVFCFFFFGFYML